MRSSAVLADSTNTPHDEPQERHCCRRLPRRTSPTNPNPSPINSSSSPSSTSRWSCSSPLPASSSTSSFCQYLGRQLSYLPRLAKLLLVDQRCCFPLPASVAPPRARRPRPRAFPRLRVRLRPRIVPRIRVAVRGQRAALRSTPLPSPSSWSPAVVVPEAEAAAGGGGGGGGGGLGEDFLCGGREGDSSSSMFGLAPRGRSTPRQQSKLQSPVAGKEGDSLVLGRRVRTLPKGLSGVVRWIGPTHFSAGVWVGVELDTRDGRNDGEVQGSRYFTCNSAHGVFVRPDHCVVLKGPGSVTAPSVSTPTSTSAARERRPRGSFGATERAPLSRKGSHASLVASEQQLGPPSSLPSNAWATGSEVGSNRKDTVRRGDGGGGGAYEKKSSRSGGSDDQIIGRLLASEAFSRVLAAAVTDRVRTEVAAREKQSKSEHEALLNRMCELEQMVDDAGGAMDDIASMVQSISENVETTATPTETDSRDAAAGGGGDAGGGGRDDARVAELTKLLCTVHDMSSQAADLLRSERKENQVRVQYLAERVNELESTNRNLLAGEDSAPSEPMEG